MNNNNEIELQPLEKHRYPAWIRFFALIIFLLFILSLISFFSKDFYHHCCIHDEVKRAKQAFLDADYMQAIKHYQDLINRYPNYKQGRIACTKASFMQSHQEPEFFFYGLYMLQEGEKYTMAEFQEMCDCLPPERVEDFNSTFEKV